MKLLVSGEGPSDIGTCNNAQGVCRDGAFSPVPMTVWLIRLWETLLDYSLLDMLAEQGDLPQHIQKFIDGFDGHLSPDEFNSPRFAYRVLFVPKTANNKGQADQVIEFIKADSELAQQINAKYAVIKETERDKFRPAQIVKLMQEEGFPGFNIHAHTQLWQAMDAKNPKHAYGTQVVKQWYWYKKWVDAVRNYCQGHSATFQ